MIAMKTTAVARALGVPVYAVHNWVRHGIVPVPPKDSSGHYLWSPPDVAAVRRARDERRPGADATPTGR